jgi:gas vesicle protein
MKMMYSGLIYGQDEIFRCHDVSIVAFICCFVANRRLLMGRFFRGMLIGVGIGLLIAPMRGEDMRRLLSERYAELRDALPDNEHLRQAGQQFATGISQTASQLKDYSQQAASKVRETSSSLSDTAKQAAQQTSQTLKQTGQETINTIR